MDLYDLPYEILFNILTNLSPQQLTNISITSKYGYEICRDDLLWRKLINDTYSIQYKINSFTSWYDNYVYVRQLFSNEQESIVEKIVKEHPKSWQLLKSLFKHEGYIDKNFITNKGYTLMGNVMIYIREYDETKKCYITVEIYRNNHTYLMSLHLGTNETLVAKNIVSSHQSLFEQSYDKGYLIAKRYSSDEYFMPVNKQQLEVLSYMYQ